MSTLKSENFTKESPASTGGAQGSAAYSYKRKRKSVKNDEEVTESEERTISVQFIIALFVIGAILVVLVPTAAPSVIKLFGGGSSPAATSSP